MRRERTAGDIAGIIEGFLTDASLYPQEWSDFVECRESNSELDLYRKRSELFGPLVNSPDPKNFGAIAELQGMVAKLRQFDKRQDHNS
jgi:hypothetical protein